MGKGGRVESGTIIGEFLSVAFRWCPFFDE
jgi:hypothetical protein